MQILSKVHYKMARVNTQKIAWEVNQENETGNFLCLGKPGTLTADVSLFLVGNCIMFAV
jgi:hypothetical protein